MLNLFTFLLEKLSLLSLWTLFHPGFTDTGKEKRELQPAPQPSHPLPRRGDLLEVPRTLFTHFGIYLGDNKVAHLIPDILPALTSDPKSVRSVITNHRLILGCICKCASVRVDSLEDFAYGSGVLINRQDGERKVLKNEEVARRAERLLGEVQYSLLWNNCEHFVTFCRYGAAESRQTEQFCECLKGIVRDQRSAIASALLGIVSIICFGLAPATSLPTILVPFTLWMAS
ncbi:lecithin retinol acyltransferase a [Neosynchiropus ocellatus]